MKNVITKAQYHAKYLAEGQWRCNKSMTGAHCWVVIRQSMTCKHCLVNRGLSLETAMPYNSNMLLSTRSNSHHLGAQNIAAVTCY